MNEKTIDDLYDEFFSTVNTDEFKITAGNRNDMLKLLERNVVELFYVSEENEKERVILTSNLDLLNAIGIKFNKTGKTKNTISSIKVMAYDLVKRKPFTIPLSKRWKIERRMLIPTQDKDKIERLLILLSNIKKLSDYTLRQEQHKKALNQKRKTTHTKKQTNSKIEKIKQRFSL